MRLNKVALCAEFLFATQIIINQMSDDFSAKLNDRFYRWKDDFVFHPTQHIWVVPLFREQNFRKRTFYDDDCVPHEIVLEDQFQLAIVAGYCAAGRNLDMFKRWKHMSEQYASDIPMFLRRAAEEEITKPLRFLYTQETANQHAAHEKAFAILKAEYENIRQYFFKAPTPEPALPTPALKPHKLPSTFRKAIAEHKAKLEAHHM